MPTPYALSSDLVSAWPAKSLEVATYLDTALASKTDLAMTQNAQTGTSYSMVLADASKLVTMSNAASNTVLVTKQATVTWVTGTQLRVMNLGAGVTTLVADTGVTINGNVALKQYQGGELIRTASDVWLFVPTASSAGMDLITPTSVAGSGVTLSGGQVSMSAATTTSVNGCFSSAYDNYRIIMRFSNDSSAPNIFARYRLAGTDAITNYNWQNLDATSTTVSASRSTAQTSGLIASGGAIGNADELIAMDVSGPALASPTSLFSNNGNSISAAYMRITVMRHTTATAYDGITISQSAGTLTGTMRIYGLRNS